MFQYIMTSSIFDLVNQLNNTQRMYKNNYNKELYDINIIPSPSGNNFYAVYRVRKIKADAGKEP